MSDKPRMLAPPEADVEENHGTLDAGRSAVRTKNLTQQPHVENRFRRVSTFRAEPDGRAGRAGRNPLGPDEAGAGGADMKEAEKQTVAAISATVEAGLASVPSPAARDTLSSSGPGDGSG